MFREEDPGHAKSGWKGGPHRNVYTRTATAAGGQGAPSAHPDPGTRENPGEGFLPFSQKGIRTGLTGCSGPGKGTKPDGRLTCPHKESPQPRLSPSQNERSQLSKRFSPSFIRVLASNSLVASSSRIRSPLSWR